MLEGRNVNLCLIEKEDIISTISEWNNNPEFYGKYATIYQDSQTELEKVFLATPEKKWFIIEKKMEQKLE